MRHGVSVQVTYAALPGTRAGIARVGGSMVVADRPAGVAGGLDLGANGAQLLAAAIGGCFWNDLQAHADRLGLDIDGAQVTVILDLAGEPRRVSGAALTAHLPADARPVFDAAAAETVISHSLMPAFPVTFRLERIPA